MSAYNVTANRAPQGSTHLDYFLNTRTESRDGSLDPLIKFIAGRYPTDERAKIIARADVDAPGEPTTQKPDAIESLPLVHILIPAPGCLGGVASPPAELALVDREGKTLSSIDVPSIKAPTDLLPKTVTLRLAVPTGVSLDGASVLIDPNSRMKEITRINNRVLVRSP